MSNLSDNVVFSLIDKSPKHEIRNPKQIEISNLLNTETIKNKKGDQGVSLMSDVSYKNSLITAQYHAPRGKKRLYELSHLLSQRYLAPSDLLIGIIGCEGVGKSTLIRGLFPGLELTNDDDGINNRRTPIYDFSEEDFFCGHTFHIDVRFESAFHQPFEIAEAVNRVVVAGKRAVVEHFDLIYNHLGFNAQIIFAIGEDLRIYRPTIFGPSPLLVREEVENTAKFRLMAHSAEDITCKILHDQHGYQPPQYHSDVKHGFVVGFKQEPDIDLERLEQQVLEIIAQDLPVKPGDGSFIEIGETRIPCTGKRVHVRSSGQIEHFRLVKKFFYDPIADEHLLVGLIGKENIPGFEAFPPGKQ